MYRLGDEVPLRHSGTQAEKLYPHASLAAEARKGYTAKRALTLKASTQREHYSHPLTSQMPGPRLGATLRLAGRCDATAT